MLKQAQTRRQRFTPIFKLFYKKVDLILLTFSLLIGLFTASHYGISIDTPIQRYTAILNYEYLTGQNQELFGYVDRDYGVAIELPLYIMEKALGLSQNKLELMYMRNLNCHILAILAAWAGFKVILSQTGSRLLGTLFWISWLYSPRIFAHSFFNSKDLAFASLVIISIFFYVRILKKGRLRDYILMGLMTSISANVRILGGMFAVFTLLYLFVLILKTQKRTNLYLGFSYFLSTVLSFYIISPYLWTSPFERLLNIINNMSNFKRGPSEVFFKGELYKHVDLPWNYLVEYILITTPVIILIMFGVGIFFLPKYLKSLKGIGPKAIIWTCLFAAILPLFLYYLKRPPIYDGWRHFFFIYGPLIMGLLIPLRSIKKNIRVVLIPTLLSLVIVEQVTAHLKFAPFQQTYFNSFVSNQPENNIRKNYELDYWAIGALQATRFIFNQDQREQISIFNKMGSSKPYMFWYNQPEQKIIRNNNSLNDYVITHYRERREGYGEVPNYTAIFNIKINNNIICTVFKRNDLIEHSH